MAQRPIDRYTSRTQQADPYTQMADAASESGMNNLSGTNTFGNGPSNAPNNGPSGPSLQANERPTSTEGPPPGGPGGSDDPGSSSNTAASIGGPLADNYNALSNSKPDSIEDQYAEVVEDDYQWWQDNYLPLYYDALHDYRGGAFDEDLGRANQMTESAFGTARSHAERTARGFGLDADLDEVKWDAMKASQKSGNRAALAPRITQDQLSTARQVNMLGGPNSDRGRRVLQGEPVDRKAPNPMHKPGWGVPGNPDTVWEAETLR